jgi:ATPase family associated with various cellular activities (AAA)
MHTLIVLVRQNPWTFAGIVALLLGCIKAIFKYDMQDLVKFLFGFILEEKAMTDYAYKTTARYLRAHSRGRSPQRDGYFAYRKTIKGLGYRWVFFRSYLSSVRLFFYKGAPIWMARPEGKSGSDMVNFVSLRGTVNWEKLLREVATWNDQNDGARGSHFRVVRYGGSSRDGSSDAPKAPDGANDSEKYADPLNYTVEELMPEVDGDPLQKLALTPAMAQILKEIKFWHGHENWYKERQIPWRRGYCLHGKPGTGKTSLVRAVAQYLDLPVFVFDIASMSSSDFYSSWKKATQSGDRIILFEDFDTVFHGRENVTKTDLSLDVVLNVLDGVEVGNGYVAFLTTNHLEHLDPALIREGRVDKTAEIHPPDYEGRYKIAYRIVTDDYLAKYIASFDGLTGAEVQERAIAAALGRLWGDNESVDKAPEVKHTDASDFGKEPEGAFAFPKADGEF